MNEARKLSPSSLSSRRGVAILLFLSLVQFMDILDVGTKRLWISCSRAPYTEG
jgi:hypothetical protein